MLWLGQKLKPGGWARRLFIITETSNKARQMNLKRKKASTSSFLVCSYCSISPAAQWQGCGHQTWWEAEHSSVTHHREGQDEPPGPSPSPIIGLPTSTKHKKQRQRAETKQKASSTSAETDQTIFGPVQNASEVIDSFCKWLCHCWNREPPGAQLSFPNGGGDYFISALLIRHIVETANLFFFFN